MLSVAGGFGNKSVFERLEALSREEEEEEAESNTEQKENDNG